MKGQYLSRAEVDTQSGCRARGLPAELVSGVSGALGFSFFFFFRGGGRFRIYRV